LIVGRPSKDVKLQAELVPGLAEVVQQARARAIAVDAKLIIEHEAQQAIEHDRASAEAVRNEQE
jgi:hypothetical protein